MGKIPLFDVEARAREVGGQAVLGRQHLATTPCLTERHGYDPTYHLGVRGESNAEGLVEIEVGGQAVLGRQHLATTPWLTERHG